jgi:hypothetical protein
MRLVYVLLAAGSALAFQLPAFATPACAQGLQINEILAGPARDWDGSATVSSRDDEWVEVRNAGAAPLDLAGFFLTDGDSIPRFAFTGVLDPGERRVVFGGDAVVWERDNGYPVFGLSLGNTGDAVLLWHVSGPDTTLIDSYAYRSHEAAADRSAGRLPEGEATWVVFDGLNPYTGTTPPQGTGCAPTPAAANVCDSTPAAEATWGAVKSRYRR